MSNYKKEGIKKLTAEILKEDLRVFVAENGEYGFYTDDKGERLVSFQYNICDIVFGGNYRSTRSGGGWRIDNEESFDTYHDMLFVTAPNWAIGNDPKWHYTTFEEHQEQYQASSRYTELKTTNTC